MRSPYKISPNSQKRKQKISSQEHDLQRPQLTSKKVTNEKIECLKSKNKNNLSGGSIHRVNEINDKYLDEILHKNNFDRGLAMQIISNDQTRKSDTAQDLKYFNSQSLATQAKKREQLVSMMPSIKKAFDLMGDDSVDKSTKNDALKIK